MSARAVFTSAPLTADWSPSRRAAFERFSRGSVAAPIAHLALPTLGSRIPVFPDTSEVSLTLGAGHLPDTSALNGDGNAAIAGHRDGFFRSLRRLGVGDRLTLENPQGVRSYRITDLWVVDPDELWVLQDTAATTLTLITCHPFYFVGHAPQRFVVRAVALADDQSETQPEGGAP